MPIGMCRHKGIQFKKQKSAIMSDKFSCEATLIQQTLSLPAVVLHNQYDRLAHSSSMTVTLTLCVVNIMGSLSGILAWASAVKVVTRGLQSKGNSASLWV